MKKSEVAELLARIKVHYQSFFIDDYVEKEWLKYLKDYDKEDVNRKLEEHLKGEYAHYEPKVAFLIKYLKTKDDKANTKPGYIMCRYCGQAFNKDTEMGLWDKCEERCRRIDYLKKKSEQGLFKLDSDLESMPIEEIDEVYYKVIEFIKGKVSEKEKNAIGKILETRN